MYCKYCGAVLDDDAKFCESCGAQVLPVKNTDPDNSFSQTSDPIKTSQSSGNQNQALSTTEHKNNNKSKPFIIGLFFLLAAAALVFAVRNSGDKDSDSIPDIMAQNNYNNGGIFAYDEAHLYLLAPKDGEDQTVYYLFSTDYGGNNKKLLSSTEHIDSIRVIGDKILFNIFDNDQELYSLGIINNDGTEEKTILTAEKEISSFDKCGDSILYLTDGELHSCSLEGKEDQVLLSGVKRFLNAGSLIYYTSEEGTFSYDRKTKKSDRLFDTEAEELCSDGDTLYYRTENAYYRMNPNGEKVKLVEDRLLHYMLVIKDYIYFVRMFNADDLANHLGSDWMEKKNSLYMVGIGALVRLPKEGGDLEIIGTKDDENIILGTTAFAYPGGLYTRLSLLLKNLEPVETLPPEIKNW